MSVTAAETVVGNNKMAHGSPQKINLADPSAADHHHCLDLEIIVSYNKQDR